MYYPKHHVIFVAINKSGSTSILHALNEKLYDPDVPEIWQLDDNPGAGMVHEYLKHAHAYFYQYYLGAEEYSRCFSFSQVRNPWDKMVSDFFFRCRSPKIPEKWKQNRGWFIKRGLEGPTEVPPEGLFKEFIQSFGKEDLKPHRHWPATSKKFNMPDVDKVFINQLDGLTDMEGNIIVDEIIRLEDASESWKHIQDVIERKTGQRLGDRPHVNKSNRTDYKFYYDEETYEIVRKLFQKDIEYFNYSF